jgi:hypothetical protein
VALHVDDFWPGRPHEGLEIVQTWDNDEFEEVDLANWVPSSPPYPLSINFSGVPETTNQPQASISDSTGRSWIMASEPNLICELDH